MPTPPRTPDDPRPASPASAAPGVVPDPGDPVVVPVVQVRPAGGAAVVATEVAVVRRDRGSIVTGLFLVATGVIGIVFAILLALVLSAVRLEPVTDAALRTLDSAGRTATDAAQAVDRAGNASLGGADVANRLADASLNAATALEVEIFGVRPLAPAAEQFRLLSDQARSLATQLGEAGSAAIAAGEDLDDMSTDVGLLGDEIERFVDEQPLAGTLGTLLGIALFAWLVLQSLAMLALGIGRLR